MPFSKAIIFLVVVYGSESESVETKSRNSMFMLPRKDTPFVGTISTGALVILINAGCELGS